MRTVDGFKDAGSPDAKATRPVIVDGFTLTMRTLVTSAPATVTSATAYSDVRSVVPLALHLERVVAWRESGQANEPSGRI